MNKINRVYCITRNVHNIIFIFLYVLPLDPVLGVSDLVGAFEALTLGCFYFHSDPPHETMASFDGK